MGVQEARTESSQRTAALFHVWSAGAAPGGHLGCELWISVSCGIAPTEVTVAHTDPRRLVCSVASPAFQGAIAVLHAPVDQGEDGDFTWWDQTLCIPQGPFLLLLEIVWCSLMRMLGWEVSALHRWVLVTRSCSPPMEIISILCWVRSRSRR